LNEFKKGRSLNIKTNTLQKSVASGLFIIFCLFGDYLILWLSGSILIIADPLTKTDAVAILSGGDQTRVLEAVKLYKDGVTNEIILTETGIILPEWNATYSSVVKLELVDSGIPENAIVITEHQVASTEDEARAIWKLMNTRNLGSVTVITDPYHSLRTRLIFQDEFEGSARLFYVHPVRNHWYRSNTWWLSLKGWKATVVEYIKLVGYFLGIKRLYFTN
jgi:uncharacterized SAM-binding protein YcdF (DUF218 family)